MNTMVLNGNKKINVWFWLIMFNIWCPFRLLVMCFDPYGRSRLMSFSYVLKQLGFNNNQNICKDIWYAKNVQGLDINCFNTCT